MACIFQKHWSILHEDPHFNSTITARPLISYRHARNLKTWIAPSKIKPASSTVSAPLKFFNIRGMYQCCKALCLMCSHITHRQKEFHSKGQKYSISDFYTCSSEFVIYCLSCACDLQYVGCTIRTICNRFGEHRYLVDAGSDQHSVPKHFLIHHEHFSQDLKVWVIEAIPNNLL